MAAWRTDACPAKHADVVVCAGDDLEAGRLSPSFAVSETKRLNIVPLRAYQQRARLRFGTVGDIIRGSIQDSAA